jgi:hypothetical protein
MERNFHNSGWWYDGHYNLGEKTYLNTADSLAHPKKTLFNAVKYVPASTGTNTEIKKLTPQFSGRGGETSTVAYGLLKHLEHLRIITIHVK